MVRNVNYQDVRQPAKQAGQISIAAEIQCELTPEPPTKSITATLHALKDLADITTHGGFTHAANLTLESIQAYALALLRVRECAGRAELKRLMSACDALAITVSELIDDQTRANRAKCEAMTRFVVHAREMILMAASEPV